jgi:glycosyltransferase involved in cell wall biosynthesis
VRLNRISVVTVCLNNAKGLAATLGSLARLEVKPTDVVVIDGGSTDDTDRVVESFRPCLPIVFISEPDRGIYDAMNKGRGRARGDLIHYLNAGDTVYGEPYKGLSEPMRLPVRITDENGTFMYDDFVKCGGYGYCHQGLVFPRNHADYVAEYHVAADLDVIIGTFPHGLSALPCGEHGGVTYALGGLSSKAIKARDREFARILQERLSWHRGWRLRILHAIRGLVPRWIRRLLAEGVSAARKLLATI